MPEGTNPEDVTRDPVTGRITVNKAGTYRISAGRTDAVGLSIRVLVGVSVTNDNPHSVQLILRRVPDTGRLPLYKTMVPPYYADEWVDPLNGRGRCPRPFLDFAPDMEIYVPAGQDVEAVCVPSEGTTIRLIWRRDVWNG